VYVGGSSDGFLTKLDNSGNICFSTYLGTINTDNINQMQVIGSEVFLVGVTQSNFPVTNGTLYAGGFGADIFFTKYNFAPVYNVLPDNVSPSTQTNCKLGLTTLITAPQQEVLPANLPILFINSVPSNQSPIEAIYQWQEATALAGPFTDIPGAQSQNYKPDANNISKYYRRLSKAGRCGAIISTSSVASVLVNAFTAPTVNAGGALLVTCSSSAITIGGAPTATGGLGPYLYVWDNGASAVANPIVAPTTNTIYTLTVTDANNCTNISQALVKTYIANAGADVSSCAGAIVRIGTPAIAGLVGAGYAWTASPVDATMSCTTCAQPDVHPLVPTTYTLTLTIPVSSGGTCSTTDAVVVTPVTAPPTANNAGVDQTFCFPGSVTLGLPADATYSYTWGHQVIIYQLTVLLLQLMTQVV
jgi:hypothetical protein